MAKNQGKSGEDRERLDPRIRALLVGRPPAERFMLAMAARELPPEIVTDIFTDAGIASGTAANLDETVAGEPFHNWLGKTEDDLRREIGAKHAAEGGDADGPEVDAKVDEIAQAFAAREMELPGAAVEPTAANVAEARAVAAGGHGRQLGRSGVNPATGRPASPFVNLDDAGQPAGDAPDPRKQGTQEPVFGKEQIPLSELAGQSDDELLAIEGIGKKTVEEIRKAQAEREKSGAAAGARRPATPPAGDAGAGH
jgi:hypothetical protein